MKQRISMFAVMALVVTLASSAFAGSPASTLNQLVGLSSQSKFSFNSVASDTSFGNINAEYDRAFSPVDLHGNYGPLFNRGLGGLVDGDDRPTTLFTGLSNNSAQDVFHAGVTGGAGEGGAYSIGLLYDSNSNQSFDDTFGPQSTDNEEDLMQLELAYGRFVNDNFWLAGSLCFGDETDDQTNISGVGTINTDIFKDESNFFNLNISAKLIGDNHALAFGIDYSMDSFEDTFNDITDTAGAISTNFNGFDVDRDGYGAFVRYSEKVSDTLEYELFASLGMWSSELDNPIFSQFTPAVGVVSDQLSTNDEVTVDSYSLRGTLLHRPHEKVDMYYTFLYGADNSEGELDSDNRVDGVVGSSVSERTEFDSTNWGFNLAARYFFTEKTAVTFGAQYLVSDFDNMQAFGPGGGPVSQTSSNENEFSNTSYRVSLTHVLNNRFRFDVGFYEDSFGGFINGGNGEGPPVNAFGGDFVNVDQFKASVTASF